MARRWRRYVMSTMTNGSGPAASAAPAAADRPMPTAPPGLPPRTRRRPGLYALGIVLIVVGALTAAWLVNTSGDQASTVVGTVAATTLVKGSLLSPGQFTAAAPPGAGQVLVPLALPTSRLP